TLVRRSRARCACRCGSSPRRASTQRSRPSSPTRATRPCSRRPSRARAPCRWAAARRSTGAASTPPTESGRFTRPATGRTRPRRETPCTQSTPPSSTNPWAFMWSTRTGNSCDETVSTQVAAPFVVLGNLCLNWTSGSQTGFVGGPLHVKGSTVTVTGTGAKSSKTSSYAVITGGTHLASGTQCKNSYASMTAHTCSASAATTGDNLAGFDRSITAIGAVTADFDYWYANASPGPKHGCNASLSTGSYSSLVFEDEVTSPTRNNSVPAAVNLTPATAYDCIVGTKNGSSGYCNTSGGSNSFGELKWDPSTKKLLILGTVYIDGSAYISNAALTTLTYSCYGTLYTSGTILLKNTKICGQYFDP